MEKQVLASHLNSGESEFTSSSGSYLLRAFDQSREQSEANKIIMVKNVKRARPLGPAVQGPHLEVSASFNAEMPRLPHPSRSPALDVPGILMNGREQDREGSAVTALWDFLLS